MKMAQAPFVVVGAGVGGLVAALELASHGLPVVVLERAECAGGKVSSVEVEGQRIDVGPTVLTMRWIFENIFARAGASLSERVDLKALNVLARHAWGSGQRLDLFADQDRSADAIADFAGPAEARGYRLFCARSAEIFATLQHAFMAQPCSSPVTLTRRLGVGGIPRLLRISPFRSMHSALGQYFRDPRLLQMFGRYATYCGSSPYLAPATLMLVAHVEQCGVWSVAGGMTALTTALEQLAIEQGVEFRYNCDVRDIVVADGCATGVVTSDGELVSARAVIANCDAQALAGGSFGQAARQAVPPISPEQRSLSAVTWAMNATTRGFPLLRHNVFFSPDYAKEFRQIQTDQMIPQQPTVYVCAQDRLDVDVNLSGPERLFCLINAPARGDLTPLTDTERERCLMDTQSLLQESGLDLDFDRQHLRCSDPTEFHRRFPATGGALYGRASHGWNASFQRPAARTILRNLYLSGGSVHPGPGIPMAAQSGVIAANELLQDLDLSGTSGRTATAGGISMH